MKFTTGVHAGCADQIALLNREWYMCTISNPQSRARPLRHKEAIISGLILPPVMCCVLNELWLEPSVPILLQHYLSAVAVDVTLGLSITTLLCLILFVVIYYSNFDLFIFFIYYTISWTIIYYASPVLWEALEYGDERPNYYPQGASSPMKQHNMTRTNGRREYKPWWWAKWGEMQLWKNIKNWAS